VFNRARLRLTIWFAGAFAAILVIIGVAVLFTTRAAIYDQVNDDLQARANPLFRSAFGPRFDPSRVVVEQFATAGGYSWILVDSQGVPVDGSPGHEELELPPGEELASETGDGAGFVSGSTIEGDDVRLYVQRVQDLQGNTYYFQVGRSIEPEQEAMRRLVVILLASGAIGMILAASGGYWLAGRALKPIQTAVNAQRTFVADASHELRTPLSLIRANAEMLKRQSDRPPDPDSIDDIIKETDRLSYVVGQMLTLARSDAATTELHKEPIAIARLAEDVGRRMQLLASEKNISVSVTTAGSPIVNGDEQRLGELLIVLLDNAIKYTDDGGHVTLTVAQSGDDVRLAITDDGRGIPPEALAHVFDRFYRVDKARSRELGGTGLGLAIAKWIVDSHNGRIAIDSSVGIGTTVKVELPAEDLQVIADEAVTTETRAEG
jgi:signal transduction histidine kinase